MAESIEELAARYMAASVEFEEAKALLDRLGDEYMARVAADKDASRSEAQGVECREGWGPTPILHY